MAIDYQRELDAIKAHYAPGPARQQAYTQLAQRLEQSRDRASLLQVRHSLSVLVHHTRSLARQERERR
jgi:hypothetical protein